MSRVPAPRPGSNRGALGEQGDVDELTARGVGQGGADDDVYVVHRLRRQRGACEPSVIQEIGVELVEMIDTQPTQRHGVDARGQM